MTCDEFLDLLDRGEALPPEALAHLDSCPACARAHLLASEAARGLDALKEDESPPDLHARLMADLPAERPRLLHRRLPWVLPLAALFVAALLGGFSLLTFLRRERPEALPLPRPSVAAPHPAIEKPEDSIPEARKQAPAEGTLPAGDSAEALPPPPPRPLELHREPPLTLSEDLGEVRPAAPAPPAVAAAPAPQANTQSLPSGRGLLDEGEPPSAGGTAEAPAAQEGAASSPVLCALETLDRSRYASLQLPPGLCPPPGAHWYVVLGEGRVTAVTDGQGRPVLNAVEEVDGAVRYLHLLPGRYKLRRVG
jgi:hypothetical protein